MALTDKQMKETCKVGQGTKTCKYIIFSMKNGFDCAKKDTTKKAAIDASDTTARGDNCEGKI